jgi:aryl-alcohol dehydrogenase-like predicted oxidoreductase
VSTRRLGNSDLNVTPVGFGAWAIGGTGYDFAWGKQDDADSIAAVHRSLELGVNWIDTAPVYGTGHSEEIVASALKEWRGSRPYVFTKCVMRWDEKGRVTTVFNRDSIRRECADSLRRLQVDVIDLYQMHWPPADNGPRLEEAWQTMAGLQKEGKVRWIGVSNFTVAQIERAEKIAHFAAASQFVDPPADRNGNTPVLREAGNWRHCVFADGIRFVDRRNDA